MKPRPAKGARTTPQTNELAHFARLPLNAVRVFAAVATHGSFSAAAEALHVTTAAVSMQIKSLEDYLQARLFKRNARNVQLTAEGQSLLPFVRRGLDELELGFRTVKVGRSSGALVVSLIASYLQRWLLPRIGAFRTAHPKIDLQFRTSTEIVDFAREDVHVAIRFGRGTWPGVHAEKLLDEWLVPVCAPPLRQRHGPLRDPKSTGDYPLLHSSNEPWSFWLEQSSGTNVGEDVWPDVGTAFDDSATVLHAAEQGQGLALTRWSIAAASIASGRLVMPYERALPFAFNYHFVCPEAYLSLAKVAKFREWLMAEAARSPKPSTEGTSP
jgi:LysR family glycine cleavage system transcriptional activator